MATIDRRTTTLDAAQLVLVTVRYSRSAARFTSSVREYLGEHLLSDLASPQIHTAAGSKPAALAMRAS